MVTVLGCSFLAFVGQYLLLPPRRKAFRLPDFLLEGLYIHLATLFPAPLFSISEAKVEDSLAPQQATGTYLDASPSQVHFLGLVSCTFLSGLQVSFYNDPGLDDTVTVSTHEMSYVSYQRVGLSLKLRIQVGSEPSVDKAIGSP